MKIIVPAEQALSMACSPPAPWTRPMPAPSQAEDCLRILTPLLKFRACRDNIPVATGAMEVRGGNGYIEEWVQRAAGARRPYRRAVGGHQQHQRARCRQRAVGKSGTHRTLAVGADATCSITPNSSPPRSATACAPRWTRTLAFVERVAAEPALEANARQAASALYHVTSAILMTWEAAQPGADARRALYARLVLDHRLSAQDPLASGEGESEREVAELVLSERKVELAEVTGLLS